MSWTLDAIDTPALVVDLNIVERNLLRAQEAASRRGLALWPHTKTHKIPLFAQRQMELGARGLTVAKIGEADVMRASGLEHLLVHYPIVGALKVRRLADLASRTREVRLAVDTREAVDAANEAARLAGREIGILVEVDTGMNRLGVVPGDEVLALARYVVDQPGLRWLGLTSFAGQISQSPDETSRRGVMKEEARALALSREVLERAGLPPEVISVGGTHHFARLDLVEVATEVRPGTYIYGDRATLTAGSCTEADLAARVLVTVVSRHAGWAVVDGGSKAFSSDPHRDGGFGLVSGHPGWRLERFSEEHGIVTFAHEEDEGPRVGDRLEIVPNHICATVNLHDQVYGFRGTTVERVLAVEGRGRLQ